MLRNALRVTYTFRKWLPIVICRHNKSKSNGYEETNYKLHKDL